MQRGDADGNGKGRAIFCGQAVAGRKYEKQAGKEKYLKSKVGEFQGSVSVGKQIKNWQGMR